MLLFNSAIAGAAFMPKSPNKVEVNISLINIFIGITHLTYSEWYKALIVILVAGLDSKSNFLMQYLNQLFTELFWAA
ncbi:protein of unknown function [Shewanella benthica]|uniref:Uncharacterized protein n=1 Tax=Shewanella benthica TaxID=43661 RepID=A0A330LZH2_9GAMM|nr:protein of unknown function [Shewanella benthica]